ncbi:MAG: hypothetical protein M1167_02700 [Chloroflexi bacterium]|nr:hypothetical protein [Chloroflexota bacterium]
MTKDKPNTQQNEELKVQVMLAIYQTDIQTQTTYIFGGITAILSIWAIVLSSGVLPISYNSLLATVLISAIWLLILTISGQRYAQRRKQLDNLRKKYCPDAYELSSDDKT